MAVDSLLANLGTYASSLMVILVRGSHSQDFPNPARFRGNRGRTSFSGTTPWEEADRCLDTYQQYWDYIQQRILPPLPRHKVLFADRDHDPGRGINDVGVNTDYYHFIQYWGRDMDADVVHHILHAWSSWSTNGKLGFNQDSLGAMFREGLPSSSGCWSCEAACLA